jgi:hypothetical protein
METKQLQGLWEAYNEVYATQEINEEVEIATEYFYEMGLNEYGIDILIEELGVEEFVEWVDEITEEYTLNEATRLQRDGRKLKGPKGSRPQSNTKARENVQGGVRMKSSKAPSSTISARKRATKAAVENQPETKETPKQEKKGIAGRLGAAFGAAVKKGREDIATTRRTAETVGKAFRTGIDALNTASDSRFARQARAATKKGLKRQQKAIDKVAPAIGGAAGRAAASVPAIADTFRAGQRLGRALRGEEYDALLSHILEEGYAANEEAATIIIENMGEEWMSTILEAHPVDDERRLMQTGRPYRQRGYLKSKPRKRSIGG